MDKAENLVRELMRMREDERRFSDFILRLVDERESAGAADAIPVAEPAPPPSAVDIPRLRRALLDRTFIRTYIAPELERYWARRQGR